MSVLARPLKWPPILPLDKGLVLWLPFDERSGAKAYDRSGKNNYGTLSGPTRVAGRRGSALSFDGVNDYVSVAHATELIPITWTITGWFKWLSNPNTAGGRFTLVEKWVLGQGGYILDWTTDTKRLRSLSKTGVAEIYYSFNPTVETWYHFTVTYDTSTIARLYKNGVLVATSAAFDDGSTSVALELGRRGASGYFFNGVTCDVRIFNCALSAAEVKRLSESELMLVRH